MKTIALLVAVVLSCSQPKGAPDMPGRFLDALAFSGWGAAAASGSVSFFQVGTLVPATVFSDDGLTLAVTQPITLDATGKTPTQLFTATPLRAIIKAASGATLQDVSRIDGDRAELVQIANANTTATDLNGYINALKTSLGGVDGQLQINYAGSVPRSVNASVTEVQVSVKLFGAKGDGLADDTAAIQATINYVAALGGGVVYFPPGTYQLSSALSVTANSVALVGPGGATGPCLGSGSWVRPWSARLR